MYEFFIFLLIAMCVLACAYYEHQSRQREERLNQEKRQKRWAVIDLVKLYGFEQDSAEYLVCRYAPPSLTTTG